MSKKTVKLDQFQITENRITHIPTGFWLAFYPDTKSFSAMNSGMAGSRLPNGDEYFEFEVKEMTLSILNGLKT